MRYSGLFRCGIANCAVSAFRGQCLIETALHTGKQLVQLLGSDDQRRAEADGFTDRPGDDAFAFDGRSQRERGITRLHALPWLYLQRAEQADTARGMNKRVVGKRVQMIEELSFQSGDITDKVALLNDLQFSSPTAVATDGQRRCNRGRRSRYDRIHRQSAGRNCHS